MVIHMVFGLTLSTLTKLPVGFLTKCPCQLGTQDIWTMALMFLLVWLFWASKSNVLKSSSVVVVCPEPLWALQRSGARWGEPKVFKLGFSRACRFCAAMPKPGHGQSWAKLGCATFMVVVAHPSNKQAGRDSFGRLAFLLLNRSPLCSPFWGHKASGNLCWGLLQKLDFGVENGVVSKLRNPPQ